MAGKDSAPEHPSPPKVAPEAQPAPASPEDGISTDPADYRDVSDDRKPDPTTVAQEQVVSDPRDTTGDDG